MRQTACVVLLLASLSGCMSTGRESGPKGCAGCYGPTRGPASVPGMQGPYGMPVSMAYPYAAAPPSQYVAKQMMNQSVPLNLVQMGPGSGIQTVSGTMPAGSGSGLMLAQGPGMPPPPGGGLPPLAPPGGMLTPPGMPFAPGMPGMPGGNPMMPGATGFQPPPGAVAAIGALKSTPHGVNFPVSRTQVRFVQPVGMKVHWYTKSPDGKESYSQFPIDTPGRYNFLQAAVYRLKLTNIPGHPGLEVYPTLEVVPANPKTAEFLAHSPVPLSFTDEDFKQIKANNYVVKVVYLPDPQYQDFAFIGPGEIISTQLDPGADPIEEARRRGNILLVIRMGSIDQQAPNTPRIDDPGAGGAAAPGGMVMPPMGGMMPPGAVPPNVMVPFGMPGPGMMPPVPPLPGHGPYLGKPGVQPYPGAMPKPGQPPLPPMPGFGAPPLPPNFGGPSAPSTPGLAPNTGTIPLPPTPGTPLGGKAGVSG